MASKTSRRGKHGGSRLGSAVFWLFTRVVVPLALVYGVLWWRAGVAIDRQIAALSPYLEIRRGSTVLALNGDVGLRSLVVRPQTGSPLPPVTLTAERAVLRTPGLLWVLRSAVFGVPDEIPSRFGFSLGAVGLDGPPEALQAAMMGGHVLFPFDLAGCEPQLSLEVANALGLRDGTSDFSLLMEYGGASNLRLTVEADTPDQAKISGDINLSLAPGGDPATQLAMAGFESMRFVVEDRGFGAHRNAYCAEKLGLSKDEFIEHHLKAVRALYAAEGLVPGVAMDQAYAGFVRSGGKLAIQARPLRPGPLMQLQGIELDGLSLFVDASVKHNDNFAAPLVFLAADQYAAAAPATDVAVPAEGALPTEGAGADGPATPAAAAAAEGETADAAMKTGPAPGDEIAYDDLPKHLGAEIEVSTTLGTVRRGVLTGASSISIVIKLAPEEGGFPLSMPKYNIVKVRLAPPPTETPESQENAQAQ